MIVNDELIVQVIKNGVGKSKLVYTNVGLCWWNSTWIIQVKYQAMNDSKICNEIWKNNWSIQDQSLHCTSTLSLVTLVNAP
jgi:hypothetical protein